MMSTHRQVCKGGCWGSRVANRWCIYVCALPNRSREGLRPRAFLYAAYRSML